MNVHLMINGTALAVPEGTTVLRAALDNGIYIPNLCAMNEDSAPEVSCRLCWVEAGSEVKPACALPVREGMIVKTDSDRALRLARSAFELLMASHDLDCGHCAANGQCELQKISVCLGVPLQSKRYRTLLRGLPPDESNPLFSYYPDRCVLCGRCVRVCRRKHETARLGFARRGFNRHVTAFGDMPPGDSCGECTACVDACPCGALVYKDNAGITG